MSALLSVRYGLVGQTLKHSFSPQFFNDKFSRLGLPYQYAAFELPSLQDVRSLRATHPLLSGLNVTIPYKEAIVPFLDAVAGPAARVLQTVNCIAIAPSGAWYGFNTDVHGVHETLRRLLPTGFDGSALVLGTGGAAKAVCYVLDRWAPKPIAYTLVGRKPAAGTLTYPEVSPDRLAETPLIIQTTPVGMYPEMDAAPPIPYEALSAQHFLFDLIYNPEETLFLKEGKRRGASIANGYVMLVVQAEYSWLLWQGGAPPGTG